MTVAELIQKLQACPPDAVVVLRDGYNTTDVHVGRARNGNYDGAMWSELYDEIDEAEQRDWDTDALGNNKAIYSDAVFLS